MRRPPPQSGAGFSWMGMGVAWFAPIRAALREPAFRSYMSGNAISVIGTWMQRTAVGWYAWELTASPFWLGMVAFADLCPAVVVGPWGGILADRFDRRRIMFWTQVAMAILTLALATLIQAQLIGIVGLVLMVALIGAFTGLNQPARLALVPSLVPREHMPTAIALNAVVFNCARFVGPAVAGIIIASAGVPASLYANALTYLPLLFVLPRLQLFETLAPAKWEGIGEALKSGYVYIRQSPVLAPLFVFFIALSLTVRSLGDLLPGFAEGVFSAGVGGLATLSAAMGLGAVAGGFWISWQAGRFGMRMALLLQALVAINAGAFALSPSFWLATLIIALFGFTLVSCSVGMHTMIQMNVDSALRGRVMSFFGLLFRSVPAIGALLIGTLAEAIGLRAALLTAALTFLAVQAWLRWRMPPHEEG